jgi:hypothetical protein
MLDSDACSTSIPDMQQCSLTWIQRSAQALGPAQNYQLDHTRDLPTRYWLGQLFHCRSLYRSFPFTRRVTNATFR